MSTTAVMTESLPLLRHFALVAVSFSTSSFLVFSVSHQGSLELCILFLLLWRYRLSFCHFALFLQPQLLFLLSPKCFFNVTQICIYSTCLFFILHLCSKFVTQKHISFSNRSLHHCELGMLKAVQIVH